MTFMKRKPPALPTAPIVRAGVGVQVPPVGVYNPPATPPAPPPPPVDNGGVFDGRCESYGKTVQLPPSLETTVATTTRPWQSLDVYVSGSMTGATLGRRLTISVYALVRGQRVLVGVGRAPVTTLISSTAFKIRCCAVRAPLAERYEVTAHWSDATARTFQVAVIASDKPWAPGDELVGAEPYTSVVVTGELDFSGADFFQGVELLQLTGANAVAAMAWVQLHEIGLNANITPAQTATWTFPVQQNTGFNLNAEDLRFLGGRDLAGLRPGRFTGLGIGLSSAVASFNAAGVTGTLSCLVR